MMLKTGEIRCPVCPLSRLSPFCDSYERANGPTGQRANGLTLIEVLVSLVILSAGAVTILQAMMRISHAQILTTYQSKAYLFALSKLGDVELVFRQGSDVKEHDDGTVRVGECAFQWELAAIPLVEEPLVSVVSLAVRWRAGAQNFQRRFETQLRQTPPAPGNS